MLGINSHRGNANQNHCPPAGMSLKRLMARARLWRSWNSAAGNREHLGETVWQFLKSLKTCLSYDSTILLLHFYTREIKSRVHTKTCTGMFTKLYLQLSKIGGDGETTNFHQQVSFCIVLYSHKEWTIDALYNMDESQYNCVYKRSQTKKYLLCDFICIKF